jgi:tetratricopeptide (TPR) repeat protein
LKRCTLDLTDRCEGNPFFLIEFLRQIEQEGGIAWVEDGFTITGREYTVPGSVEDVVYRRLDKLDAEVMALAEYASCLGREFDLDATLSFEYASDPMEALGGLESSGIIVLEEESSRFSHAIFRDVIYGSVSNRWLRIYHKSLGEYYERTFDKRTDEILYELARHYGRSNAFPKALDYNMRAGEKAATAFAPEQAIEFFNMAVKALPRVGRLVSIPDLKVDINERLGDLYSLTGGIDKAFESYDVASQIAPDKRTKARMLRKLGGVHEKTGDYDRSLESLAQAKELIMDETDPEHGRICIGEGYAYFRKTEYEKAMAKFVEALKVFEGYRDEGTDLGNSYRAIGNVHYALADLDLALESYNHSLHVMERNDDHQGMGQVLNNMGLLYRIKGELDNAVEYFLKANEILKKVGDKKSLAALLNNIGNVYTTRGDLDTALEYHNQSLEIKQAIGNRQGEAMSLNNIGNIYQQTSQLDKALECHSRALGIRETIGDRVGAAASLNNLGNTYFATGDFEKAQEYNHLSLKLKEEIGDKLGRALSYINMGHSHLARKELEKAEEVALTGLELSKDLGDKEQIVPAHQILSEVYTIRGEYDKALSEAKHALELAIDIGAKSEEGFSHNFLGMVYRERGDLEESINEFEKAIELLETLPEKPKLVRALHERALLMKKMGDGEKARDQLESVIKMYDDMRMSYWSKRASNDIVGL